MKQIFIFILAVMVLASPAFAKPELKFPHITVRLPASYTVTPMTSANSFFAEDERSTTIIARREFPLRKPSAKMVGLIWAQNLEAVGLKTQPKDCQKKGNNFECRQDSSSEKILMLAGNRQLLVLHQKSKLGSLTKADQIQLVGSR